MAARRRGQNEGSVYLQRAGLWAGAASVGAGRRKYVYGRTRQEAAAKLARLLADYGRGVRDYSGRLTVAQLASQWLEYKRSRVALRTGRRYGELLRLHVLPALGGLLAVRLGPSDLLGAYEALLRKGLSPQTAKHVHRAVYSMLEDAVRWDLIGRNVARLVESPRVPRREMRALSWGEVQALLDAARGDPFEALWALAVGTGMRSGEMLGLRWEDVDLERRLAQVRRSRKDDGTAGPFGELKTDRSRRVVAMPEFVADALGRRRLVAGGAALVFCTHDGRPLRVDGLARRLRPMLALAGIVGKLRVHDLRHTAVSLMLQRGVSLTDVSAQTGDSVEVLARVYAHVLPGAAERAASVMDGALAVQVAGRGGFVPTSR